MKEVIDNLEDKLTIDQVGRDTYIGVEPKEANSRYMLVNLPVEDKSLKKWALVNANASIYLTYGDKRDIIKNLLDDGLKNIRGYYKIPSIYVFKSESELYKWLGYIENENRSE